MALVAWEPLTSTNAIGEEVSGAVVGNGDMTSNGESIPEEAAASALDEAANLGQSHLTAGTGDTKGVGVQGEVATSFVDELFDQLGQFVAVSWSSVPDRRRPIDGPPPSTQTSRATSFLQAGRWPLAVTSGVLMAGRWPLGPAPSAIALHDLRERCREPCRLPASVAASNGYSFSGQLTVRLAIPAMVPDCHRLLHSAAAPAPDAGCLMMECRARFPKRKRSQLGESCHPWSMARHRTLALPEPPASGIVEA